MNAEYSEMNKSIQTFIKKESTYKDAINQLLILREKLMKDVKSFQSDLTSEQFYSMPFMNAQGYHNKTIVYSLWHIFRIEDIVTHSLIKGDQQIFFKGNYQERINSPVITTGNELMKQQVKDFSEKLDLNQLYQYINEVKESTDQILKDLSYQDLKHKITPEDKDYLESFEVVSKDENVYWLIDYWCKKDIRGLLLMPLSRHWIMHIEASIRIKNKVMGEKHGFSTSKY